MHDCPGGPGECLCCISPTDKMENVADVFDALTQLANGSEPVTEERLHGVLEHLTSGTRITNGDGSEDLLRRMEGIPNLDDDWSQTQTRMAQIVARTDPTGMTRRPRDPDERAFLERTGGLGPFVERRQSSDTTSPVRGMA